MTPTATYIAEENCLQELPRMKKPLRPNPYTDSIDAESLLRYKLAVNNYENQIGEYYKHLATLRKMPCSPEPGFKNGEKYTEGVDYEIKGAGDWKWCYQLKGNIFAAPLVPVKSDIQDRTFTFHETLDLIADFGRHVLSAKNEKWDMANDAAEWLNDQLKKYFPLTKR